MCWKHVGKLRNILSATNIFLNLLGNVFASREANFVSATMFLGVGKLGNIDNKKQDVSATMFPGLPKVLKTVKRSSVSHLFYRNTEQ
jgi:hypothetical protein